MAYTSEVEAIIAYIENRVKEKIDFKALEAKLNYSYRHIRGIFKNETGQSLSHYILSRKIAYCAHDIVYSSKKLVDIACDYNLGAYDTFSRAFKRETGLKPSEFKASSYRCGIKHICMGVYAPSILKDNESNEDIRQDLPGACMLYGVSRVYYGRKHDGGLQFAPFAMCLQSVLSYLGQEVHYAHLMAATGSSFRLTWHVDQWDLRAVDERHIYKDPMRAFKQAFDYVGRDYKIYSKGQASKASFKALICQEISQGRPLIALGLVGPPDACIITGYKDEGDRVLGWSLVQDHLEFSQDIDIDGSGYFDCRAWWESTEVLMTIGQGHDSGVTLHDHLSNGLDVLSDKDASTNDRGHFVSGQRAYKALIDMVSGHDVFSEPWQYARLNEALLAFRDGLSMIWDGRSYGAGYMSWLGSVHDFIGEECHRCSRAFRKIVGACVEVNDRLGGLSGEVVALNFACKETRLEVVRLLRQMAVYEAQATESLKEIVKKLKVRGL